MLLISLTKKDIKSLKQFVTFYYRSMQLNTHLIG